MVQQEAEPAFHFSPILAASCASLTAVAQKKKNKKTEFSIEWESKTDYGDGDLQNEQ